MLLPAAEAFLFLASSSGDERGEMGVDGDEEGMRHTELTILKEILGLLAMAFGALVAHSAFDTTFAWTG